VRASRSVLREAGGETPPAYSTAYQREEQSRALHGTAQNDPQTHTRQVAKGQAAASDAHARSAAPNRKMAAVGRPRPLQLLRGTGKPRKSGDVPRPGAGAMVAYSPPPEPETPDLVDAYSCLGSTLASATEHASSLSRCTLCRQSSEIRTGCANKRSSGSEEGVVRNHDPYSDQQLHGLDKS